MTHSLINGPGTADTMILFHSRIEGLLRKDPEQECSPIFCNIHDQRIRSTSESVRFSFVQFFKDVSKLILERDHADSHDPGNFGIGFARLDPV